MQQWNMILDAVIESQNANHPPSTLLGTLLAIKHLIFTKSYKLNSICLRSTKTDFPDFIMKSPNEKQVLFEVRNVIVPEIYAHHFDHCLVHIQDVLDKPVLRKNEGIEAFLDYHIVPVIWASNAILSSLAKAIHHHYVTDIRIKNALAPRIYYNKAGKPYHKTGRIRDIFA